MLTAVVAAVLGCVGIAIYGMVFGLFLQGIDRSSEIVIRWNGTTCDIDVPYPTGTAIITKMGDIACVPRSGK